MKLRWMTRLQPIKVKVVAYGKIRKYLGDKSKDIAEIKIGSSVKDLFQLLKKPDREIWMVNVNGILVNEERELKDGDEVRIFESIGGGEEPVSVFT